MASVPASARPHPWTHATRAVDPRKADLHSCNHPPRAPLTARVPAPTGPAPSALPRRRPEPSASAPSTAEAGLPRSRAVRGEEGHRRPGAGDRAALRLPARPGPLPARRRARPGQDAGHGDAGPHRGRHVQPAAVHARPAARRHRRHPHLPALDRGLRRRAGPDLRQLRAGRRGQPGPGQGAVRPARGDGRATRVDRRAHLPGARAVPRAGHPEPDRVGGRLPAARGPARPVPDEGPGRTTPPAPRRWRSCTAWAWHAPQAARCSTPARPDPPPAGGP